MNFFTKNPNLKKIKKKIFFGGGGGGVCVCVGGGGSCGEGVVWLG